MYFLWFVREILLAGHQKSKLLFPMDTAGPNFPVSFAVRYGVWLLLSVECTWQQWLLSPSHVILYSDFSSDWLKWIQYLAWLWKPHVEDLSLHHAWFFNGVMKEGHTGTIPFSKAVQEALQWLLLSVLPLCLS